MLRVITWHRIADPHADTLLHPRLVSATPDVFVRQIEHLAARYRVVSLGDVLAAFRSERPLPSRAVLLTFDDGYRDFLAAAWPALEQRGLPATMFVPTSFPGRPGMAFWWDRLHAAVRTARGTRLDAVPEAALPAALRALPIATPAEKAASLAVLQRHVKSLPHDAAMASVEAILAALGEPEHRERAHLDWDELRALQRRGLELAPHTRTHPLLTRVSPARAVEEIAGSLADLRRECGDVPAVHCYPSGAFDDGAVQAMRAAGAELAFTQQDGHNRPGKTDPLRLCRTNITRRTNSMLFALRLQSWFTRVDRWRHRDKRQPAALASQVRG